MPYIGHSPTQAGSYIEVDDFGSSFNGSTVAFTLQVGGVNITPNQQNLLVMIDGVLQQPSNAFSVSGSTITFTEAPVSGADLYCLLMGQSASVGQGTIGADELKVSGDGSDGQVLKSDGDGTFTWLSQDDIAAGTLANARTINGVSFNGSANITVTADANTLSNTTLKSTVVNSSLTSVGTLSSLTLGGDLTLPQKIVHSGDTDTYLSFGTDSLSLYTGGTNVVDFIYGNIYIKGNNKALVGYTTGASAKELIKINASDNLQIGEAGGGDVKITERLTVGSWDNSNTHGHAYIDISSDANEGADSCLYFGAGTTVKGSIYYNHNATAASQQMYFVTGDNSTNSLILDNSSATFAGTVSIGAGNDTKELRVNRTKIRHLEGLADNTNWTGAELYINHINNGNIYMSGTGSVGIGTSSINSNAKLHIRGGSSGQTSSSNNTQLTVESSGTAGIQLLTGTTNVGGFWVGDSNGAETGGKLYYSNSSDSWIIYNQGSIKSADLGTSMLNLYDNDTGSAGSTLKQLSLGKSDGTYWDTTNTGTFVGLAISNANGDAGTGCGIQFSHHAGSSGVSYIVSRSERAYNSGGDRSSLHFGTRGSDGVQRRMIIGDSGVITMSNVYGRTVGATNRDVYIGDGGDLGYVSSVREHKMDIKSLSDVTWLSDLNPVSFYRRKIKQDGTYGKTKDGSIEYGLIADEVEKVNKDFVFYDIDEDENKVLAGVEYRQLIVPMLKKIQELEAKVEALENA